MQWAELKADEISALDKDNSIVIVPVASLEHHGPHLPTGVDIVLTTEIARRAARLPRGVAPERSAESAARDSAPSGTPPSPR